jgi:hydroxymethylpyrimidine/phosphomethylpyrimidine kinase
MLGSADIIRTVARALQTYHPAAVVLDPVMISKSGHHLLEESAVSELKTSLLPLADLVTPNIPEAEELTGLTIQTKQDVYRACQILYEGGAKAVLVKGGHLAGNPNDLFYDGETFFWLKSERIRTKNTHGTGCTLSAAIAANLANGIPMKEAVEHAKQYMIAAIRDSLSIGKGHGPVNHFHAFFPEQGGVLNEK